MRVAPSSYYAARARPLSARSARDEALTDVIRRVWEENYCVFGVRKMHAFLNTHELGVGHVARCTVERLMRRMGIRGVSRRRTRHVTASAPRHACPLDLVNRHFGAHDLNELWVADITYVPTQAGWVYVAFVTDVCSRKILGWKVASSLHTDVALDALNMAICQRRRDDIDTRGLVHHSDRGVQYRDVRYGQALARCQAVASVGSTGDSYDNALAEALNSLMCPGYCGECLRPDWRFGMSGQRKYSMELRERATRMALEARADPERRRGAIKRIGGQLGVNPEALRTWVRAVEQGGRNERGEISDQEARIRALEAENRELRRANEILKAASAFFGAELDRLGR